MPIRINCLSVPGYEDPIWIVNTVNEIQRNRTVQNSSGSEVARVYVITLSTYSTVLEINIPSSFPDELNGVYTCQSPDNRFSTSVILTNSEFVSIMNIVNIFKYLCFRQSLFDGHFSSYCYG